MKITDLKLHNQYLRAAVLAALFSSSAWAEGASGELQSLGLFLRAAAVYSPDNREAKAQAQQQTESGYGVIGRSLPSLNAKGTYTYNQYESVISLPGGLGPITVQAHNQLDAYFTLNVPLIDVGTWVRGSAARQGSAALDQTAKARALDVQRQVVRTFYQLVAAQALTASAQHNLQLLSDNYELMKIRKEGGVASDLDVERAQAQVESGKQNVADAALQVELARQQLQSLSGVEPAHGTGSLEDDLHEEAPLQTWTKETDRIAYVQAATLSTEAARRNATGAKLAFLPTITGQFQERLSNVTGFTGRNSTYVALLAANWTLDFTTFFNAREQSAYAAMAEARETRARLAAQDAIHQAWQRVNTQIIKVRAALAGVRASAHAAAIARERSRYGAATQLDVLQAERDAFAADAARIQAQADLAYARAELRLSAGQSLEEIP